MNVHLSHGGIHLIEHLEVSVFLLMHLFLQLLSVLIGSLLSLGQGVLLSSVEHVHSLVQEPSKLIVMVSVSLSFLVLGLHLQLEYIGRFTQLISLFLLSSLCLSIFNFLLPLEGCLHVVDSSSLLVFISILDDGVRLMIQNLFTMLLVVADVTVMLIIVSFHCPIVLISSHLIFLSLHLFLYHPLLHLILVAVSELRPLPIHPLLLLLLTLLSVIVDLIHLFVEVLLLSIGSFASEALLLHLTGPILVHDVHASHLALDDALLLLHLKPFSVLFQNLPFGHVVTLGHLYVLGMALYVELLFELRSTVTHSPVLMVSLLDRFLLLVFQHALDLVLVLHQRSPLVLVAWAQVRLQYEPCTHL